MKLSPVQLAVLRRMAEDPPWMLTAYCITGWWTCHITSPLRQRETVRANTFEALLRLGAVQIANATVYVLTPAGFKAVINARQESELAAAKGAGE